MRKMCLILILIALSGCGQPSTPTVGTPESTKVIDLASSTLATETATVVEEMVTATMTATTTPAPTTTVTPLPTPYSDGSLNCPGSVALMYHTIYPLPDHNTDYLENNTDIVSFEQILIYLIDRDYYFPTPEEFASDIKTRTCRHKYAILIIDDSWNDPEAMGVTEVLIRNGGGTVDGSPKVWFAAITRQMYFFINENGESVDPWDHLRFLTEQKLVYVVSHSQTHQLGQDKKSHRITGEELLPSRKDILYGMKSEPYFFVYPGGIVADPIIDNIQASGYIGAFTVWEGGMDGAYPLYLPRINGSTRCEISGVVNPSCLIEIIEKYADK